MKEKEVELVAFVEAMDPEELRAFVRKQLPTNTDLEHALQREKDRGNLTVASASLKKRLRACLRKVGPYDSRRVSSEMHTWLEEVEQDVLPFNPANALALVELLMHAPEIGKLDDSYGFVGNILNQACIVWLRSVAGMEAEDIMTRLRALYDGPRSEYFDWALSRADFALNEGALRELARRYEDDFKALEGSEIAQETKQSISRDHCASAILLLAMALRDPDLKARSTLLLSPEPNGKQRTDIVKAYIQFGRPAEALPWLAELPSWGHYEFRRLDLLDQIYTGLGDWDQVKQLRGESFRRQPSGTKFLKWCKALDADERAKAVAQAGEIARQTLDPYAGMSIGFALDDIQMAESVALRLAHKIHASSFEIESYADTFENAGAIAGATVCYRVLLEDFLDKANSTTYAHAVRYWKKLQQFVTLTELPEGVEGAQAYLDRMSIKHARKPSFWKRIGAAK